MTCEITFQQFVEVVRNAVLLPQGGKSFAELIMWALAAAGFYEGRLNEDVSSMVLCGSFACYAPPAGISAGSAFREFGATLERLNLRGGVLLAKPHMTEYITEWNLRSGEALPVGILPTQLPEKMNSLS